MKKNIIIKSLIVVITGIIIFSIFSVILVDYYSNKIVEDNLIRITDIYTDEFTNGRDAHSIIEGNKDSSVRITIIDSSGKVIADSYNDESVMENHIDREEIKNINTVVKRYSKTNNMNLLYYANKTVVDGEEYYVRVSIPTENINGYISGAVPLIIAVMTLMLIVLIIIQIRMSNKIIEPIYDIENSLKSIKDSNNFVKVSGSKFNEINDVLREVNEVGEILNNSLKDNIKEKEKLNYVLDNMIAGIVVLDSNKNVLLTNRQFERIFSSNNCNGKNIVEVIRYKDIIDNLALVSDRECIREFNYIIDSVNYNISIRKIIDNSENDIAYIIVVRDITKEKKAENERRQFFSNASHELKTPLTAIKGYGEMIENKIVSGDKITEYSSRIVTESERLLGIIEDMLRLSRLDEMTEENVVEYINVYQEAEKVIEELFIKCDNHVTVKLFGEDCFVKMSRVNLRHILINLISNAVKYNKENGEVDVNISYIDENIVIEVSDTGIGIPEEDLERIGERFFRVDRSHKTGGTGLGLAIVKHIAMLYKGTFSVESTVGSGTTVKVTIPSYNK